MSALGYVGHLDISGDGFREQSVMWTYRSATGWQIKVMMQFSGYDEKISSTELLFCVEFKNIVLL